MRRAYCLLDVFTETPLAGNPLAVVLDADGLDDARMQAIAARVQPARDRVRVRAARSRQHRGAAHLHAGARIAVRRSSDGRRGGAGRSSARAADARRPGSAPGAGGAGRRRRLRRPPPPRPGAGGVLHPAPPAAGRRTAPAIEEIAQRLGLAPADIGFGDHRPIIYGAGVDFVFAPLASADALARADPDVGHWGADNGAAIYCYTPGDDGVDYRARMFASGWGIREDPATGSAAAAFAGIVMRFAPPGDGERTLVIAQGVEMGRPSRIALSLDVEKGALATATIGGSAVLVAEGTIDL